MKISSFAPTPCGAALALCARRARLVFAAALVGLLAACGGDYIQSPATPAAPAIAAFSATPATLPATGGQVSLSSGAARGPISSRSTTASAT